MIGIGVQETSMPRDKHDSHVEKEDNSWQSVESFGVQNLIVCMELKEVSLMPIDVLFLAFPSSHASVFTFFLVFFS